MSKNFLSEYLCRPPTEPWDHCIEHYCPACDQLHLFAVDKPFSNGSQWKWNGNVRVPTFSPSMVIVSEFTDKERPTTRCHYFLTEGQINYLSDCTHSYVSKTITLHPSQRGTIKKGKNKTFFLEKFKA